MLRTRILTALVLLALLLPSLFVPSAWPFIVLCLVLVGAAAWEWMRLNGAAGASALVGAALFVLVSLGSLGLDLQIGAGQPSWWAGSALWVLGGAAVLRAGPGAWPRLPAWLRWGLGLLILLLAWQALARARVIGVNFLLSLLCIVWAADIAAYFGGKAFGKHKLALQISPGKSWEGAWFGIGAALLLALLWLQIDSTWSLDSASVFKLLLQRWGATGMVAAVIVLAAMSIVGDLFESLVKRAAGAKDSSNLLPGHGGVLDRVDALLPVLPLAMAFIGS